MQKFSLFYAVLRGDFLFAVRKIIIKIVNRKEFSMKYNIGFVFVDEEYRGNRLSQQLIEYVVDYIKNIGYNKVHIVK